MYLIYCNDEIVAKFYGRQYAEIVEEIVLNNSTPNEVWEAEWVEIELIRRQRVLAPAADTPGSVVMAPMPSQS